MPFSYTGEYPIPPRKVLLTKLCHSVYAILRNLPETIERISGEGNVRHYSVTADSFPYTSEPEEGRKTVASWKTKPENWFVTDLPSLRLSKSMTTVSHNRTWRTAKCSIGRQDRSTACPPFSEGGSTISSTG